jgi:ribonuclease T2
MRLLCALLVASLFPDTSMASNAATGTFSASRGCDAYLSFRKGTNPGSVQVKPGAEYSLREVNDQDANWVRVEISGLTEPLRWVARECGVLKDFQVTPVVANPKGASGDACSLAGQHESFVLAVTWQPGFCEHFPFDGTKPECEQMAKGRLVVSNLTLHGLWPNRKACGKEYGNCGGSEFALSEDTVSYISAWMPNFYYEQVFGRYEWAKHGTCSGIDSNLYFRRAVDSVKTVNEAGVGKYVRTNIGGSISKAKFYDQVRSDTGQQLASNAFTLICADKYLVEIRVRLPLIFKEGGSLNQLLGDALPQDRDFDKHECKDDEIWIEASGQ